MVKISAIVPVYNSEKYLEESILSILNQSEKDLEVILINDGSTDFSGQICNKLAKIDNRVRIYHKENEGVCAARNYGLERASGEFISFVDSDDFLCSDMYEFLLENMNDNNADISICGVKTIFLNGKVDDEENPKKYVLNKEQAIQYILERKLFNIGLWTKLIRRGILEGLLFEEDRKIGEDKFYFFQAILKSETIVFEDKKKYFYYKRTNSATTGQFSEKNFDMVYFAEKMEEISILKYPQYKLLAELNTYIENINIYRNIVTSPINKEKYKDKTSKILQKLESRYHELRKYLYLEKRIELNLLLRTPNLYLLLAKMYKKIKYGI